jgi:YD repeat-containing protein
MGRITSISTGGQTTSYTYDEYGQLIEKTNLGLDKTSQYEYNEIGNISSVTTNGTTVNFGYTNSSHPDRLTSYNGKTMG